MKLSPWGMIGKSKRDYFVNLKQKSEMPGPFDYTTRNLHWRNPTFIFDKRDKSLNRTIEGPGPG